MRILFFTPTYNNINTCNAVIKSIRKTYDNEILIFDDGSEPRFRLKQKLKNITIKRNFKNAGKGNVILQGFKYAKENDYSHIITIDSDMQHDPVYLKDFIDAPVKYDIVYGRRYFNKDMPYSRIISNWITSKIISYISKCKIYDSQCGFRRYNISFIENIDLIEKESHIYPIKLNFKTTN